MTGTLTKSLSASRAQSIAFAGLSIALIAVSAWITIPLGPVPFTLQVFVILFAFLLLPGKLPIAVMAGYLLLGAVGLPVFSGMRGGIGMLMGPTGGFLLGWLAAAVVCVALAKLLRGSDPDQLSAKRQLLADAVIGVAFLAVTYVCGWGQFMFVAHVDALQSFMVTVAPFVVIDAIKVVAAIFLATTVRKAVGSLSR